MIRLRSVDTNPVMVPARSLRHPLTDAGRYAKCATVVTELFSEHLAGGPPLIAKTSWVRFLPTDLDGPAAISPLHATSALGLGEVHEVPYDRKVLDLPDDDRRRAILDWLRDHMLALGSGLNWDPGPIEAAYEACLRDGCRYRRTGAAKASPNRRWKAHVEFEIDGDGEAWSWLVVTDRAGAVLTVGERRDSVPFARRGRKVLRSVRWDGDVPTWTSWIDDVFTDGPP
ncbi:hypothetical protein [Actinoplanes sp. NPDC048796]|uniref:hypothetical protein n=1 Tax=Actinoplanes sp. NPDC048796 TaxID=3155640 RepID=UPI0033F18275